MDQRAARLERERAFHDDRYTDESRLDAQKYYSVTRASHLRFEHLLDRLAPGQRALEIGCGVNATAWGLARRGVRVTAIDLSPVAVEEFSKRAADEGLSATLDARVMNAEQLEFEAGSFDAVLGTGILHHLDLESAYSQVSRVLARDAFGAFVEPLGHNPAVNVYRRLTPRMRTPDEHPLLFSDFEMARRWFGTVDVSYFHLLTLCAVPFRRSSRFPELLHRLERADDRLFGRMPATRALAWMSVVELAEPRSS